MPCFYFDIETTGLDSKKDKIITIQFQELGRNTGAAVGELKILKEWESSERTILSQFLEQTRADDPYPFAFVPIGYNLTFEHNFIKERLAMYGLPVVDILSHPFIDLRACGVIMNNGEFKGSGLDKITGKKTDGSKIPPWYESKEYDKIEAYIKDEAQEFIKFNTWLYKELPKCLAEFKKTIES